MEKETLGLFLSSHPFKEVRAALRLKVDCGLADLAKKRDGDWVTVGGMIAESKKIRTKKGDPMLFATLDDLEAQVEILVFSKAYEANAEKIDTDKVVIVRGRVDHKEQGETKVVVQECQPFEPTPQEVQEAQERAAVILAPPRLTLRVPEGIDAGWLEDLKELVKHNKGDHELAICVGERTLVLGEQFRVAPSRFCAELEELPTAPEIVAA
jgi:DNA polymerase-3 subunit alpha